MKLMAKVENPDVAKIRDKVVDIFCSRGNPGHANGKNNPQFLKNYEYHHRRYQRALKALEFLDDYVRY